MPILNTEFQCSNGHQFNANAKLRARCPTCGELARRRFEGRTTPADAPHGKPAKGPVILRAGKPRVPRAKPQPQKEPEEVPTPRKPSPAQVRARKAFSDAAKARSKTASAAASAVKKTPAGKAANGLVRTRQLKGPVTPGVTRRPKRTSVSKVTAMGSIKKKPYWHNVAEKFMKFR